MPFYTPLRYPGGKRKLANFFKLVVKRNALSDGHYVEPYAGGAAVALDLLFDEYVSYIHINDLDRAIYAFWHSMLYQAEELCRRIYSVAVTMDEWYRQREVQEQADTAALLDLGFSTFFLNRTNRSGIIWGGVIGGKGQDGPYKMDARFTKENLVQRIQRIRRYRSRITIHNQDAADLIQDFLPSLPDRTLVYLDPPYYSKGKDLYKNTYEHQDHEQIANLITEAGRRWIVTYDNTPQIVMMYGKYPFIVYDLHYSATDRCKGSEVMFLSDKLEIPPVDSPVRISRRLISELDK